MVKTMAKVLILPKFDLQAAYAIRQHMDIVHGGYLAFRPVVRVALCQDLRVAAGWWFSEDVNGSSEAATFRHLYGNYLGQSGSVTLAFEPFSLLQEPSAMLDTLQQADVLYMCGGYMSMALNSCFATGLSLRLLVDAVHRRVTQGDLKFIGSCFGELWQVPANMASICLEAELSTTTET